MFFAIDIGGTKVRVASSQLGHELDASVRFETPVDQSRVVPLIQRSIEKLGPGAPVDGIGISAPEAIDRARGVMLHQTNLSWRNFHLVSHLRKLYDCPIHLENDATCGGVAEARQGAGRGRHSTLYISISTGIGCSFIVSGSPAQGIHNPEPGKMIIMTDHSVTTYEQWASGKAIAAKYGKIAADIHDHTTWKEISTRLAIVIHNLAILYSPDIIVLGGGVSVHYSRFIKLLEAELIKLPHPYPYPPIRQAENVELAPALGALLLIHHH